MVIYNNSTGALPDNAWRRRSAIQQFGRALESDSRDEISGYLSRRRQLDRGPRFPSGARSRAERSWRFAVGRGDFVERSSSLRPRTSSQPGTVPVTSVATNRRCSVEGTGSVGSVFGGFWLDSDLLVEPQGDTELSVAVDGPVIASTAATRRAGHGSNFGSRHLHFRSAGGEQGPGTGIERRTTRSSRRRRRPRSMPSVEGCSSPCWVCCC